MKFEVALSDLEAALAVVTPAMAKSGGDTSAHYVFRPSLTDPAMMEVLTYTSRVQAGAAFVAGPVGGKDATEEDKAAFADKGSFTIEGSRLTGVLSVLKQDSVLVFSHTKKETEALTTMTVKKDAKKQQVFPSLDPAHFPYWDKVLAGASPKTKIKANKMLDVIERVRLFNSEDESKQQGYNVSEVRELDGQWVLSSTNLSTLCLAAVPELKGVKMRIHFKDVPLLKGFLTLMKEEEIEILEAEVDGKPNGFYFRRPGPGGGSYIGETRFHETFGKVLYPPQNSQYTWKVEVKDLRDACKFLHPGKVEDDRIIVSYKEGPDRAMPTTLDLISVTGSSQNVYDVPLLPGDGKTSGTRMEKDAPELPEIQITATNLLRLLDAVTEPQIELGANLFKGGKGYFRVESTRFVETDTTKKHAYVFMLMWKSR